MSSAANSYDRPPLPEVERHSLTDAELFQRLDRDHPAMARVLEALEQEGPEAAKTTLANHFRQRREPYWRVDPHARTSESHTISERDKRHADHAMNHYFDLRKPAHQFGEDIDWLDNPTYAEEHEFDKEWSMGFLRMPWWGYLGKAYWATGDEAYAREILDQFRDFRDDHPIPTKNHGWLSSHPLKYVTPEWRTLETSIRIRGAWSEAYFRLLTSPSLDDETLTEMVKAFWEMGDYLRRFTRTEGRTNNWTTSQLLSLHTVAALFPEFQASREWRDYAVEYMWKEFQKQVYPDGVQWELAPGYGVGVTKQFRGLVDTARMAGDTLPEAYMKRLEDMYSYYLYSSVNGRCAAFGDSGHGSIRSIMQLAAQDFPQRDDFQWAASDGERGTTPERLLEQWPWAGQVAMRSGWDKDDRFITLDAGPYGVSHQNEDCLSYELYAYGDWLIPDPGSYRYNYDSPWRRFMTGSLSHNTLVVDHQGQNRRSQKDLWVAEETTPMRVVRGDRNVYMRATYDHGYGPGAELRVEHTRSVFFIDGRFWVIVDRATPRDEDDHLYETLMMLNSDEATADDTTIVTARKDGPNILIAAADQPGQRVSVTKGQMEPVRRGWKKGGKTVVPNPTAAVGLRTQGPARFALLLYPLEPGKQLPDDIGIEFIRVDGGENPVAVRVTVPSRNPVILTDQLGSGTMTVGNRRIEADHAVIPE